MLPLFLNTNKMTKQLKKFYINNAYMYYSMYGKKQNRLIILNAIINVDYFNNIIILN